MKYTSANVTKRRNGYQVRLKYKDSSGKWLEHTKMLPKEVTSKKEAKRLAYEWQDYMNRMAGNSPNASKDKTITDTVSNYITSQFNSGELEKSSYKQQMAYLNKWITPYIGSESFFTVTRDSINGWLTELNMKGYSQNTICCAFYLLRKVYNYYYQIGDIVKNPFDRVKPPKKGKPRTTYLTDEQMHKFLSCLENEPPQFKTACLLGFYAGLRRGEITALRWRDVNFNNGTIAIESAIGTGIGGSYTKQPKTKSSIRTFPIVPQLLNELKNRYNEINPKPNWFVVGKETKYYDPNYFGIAFRKWVKANSLVDAYDNPITLHTLRHNFANCGVKNLVDINSLSAMLGHSSRAMTLDVYGSPDKDALIEATNKLGEGFE